MHSCKLLWFIWYVPSKKICHDVKLCHECILSCHDFKLVRCCQSAITCRQTFRVLTWIILLKVLRGYYRTSVSMVGMGAFGGNWCLLLQSSQKILAIFIWKNYVVYFTRMFSLTEKWWLVMHFSYHLDGLTVSVNHFHRVRYVDLKYDYGFVVSIISYTWFPCSNPGICPLIVYFIRLFILSAPLLFFSLDHVAGV